MKPPIDPERIPPRVTRRRLPPAPDRHHLTLTFTLSPPEFRRLHNLAFADRRTWQDWCRVLIRRTLADPR